MRSIIQETRIDTFRWYHLSKQDNLAQLEPDIPDNYMTKNGFEDNTTKRISFAPSINQCLMALSRNVSGEEFFVYILRDVDKNKLQYPNKNKVPDVGITSEAWVTVPVRVQKFGKIRVLNAGTEKHEYKYANNQTAALYDWDYRVIVNENGVVKEFAPSTYKNIIFDLGGVLIQNRVDAASFMNKYKLNEDELRSYLTIYYETVYKCQELSYSEALNKYIDAISQYDLDYELIKAIFNFAVGSKQLYDYTIPLLKKLKKDGYKLYYLSNWTKSSYEYCKYIKLFDFLKYFDGGLFSFQENLLKPNHKFYLRLMNRYKLNIDECILFDDQQTNIDAANIIGLKAVKFTSDMVNTMMKDDTLFNEVADYSRKNHYPVFIVLYYSGTILTNVIKLATGDEYTHACIAFSPDLKPLYSFGNKNESTKNAEAGFVIQEDGPDSKFYKNYKAKYAVYVMYVNKAAYNAMQASLNSFIAKKDEWKFDFLNLISVFFNKESEKSEKYFCSKFVAHVINAGYKLDKAPSLYRPETLKYLDNITCIDKGDDFKLYNVKRVMKNLQLVKKQDFDSIKLEAFDIGLDYGNIYPEEDNKIYDPANKQTIHTMELELPDMEAYKPDISSLFDNTPLDHIYLTSDWHFFKNHYKHEANYVNTQEILKWCRQNIKPDDVFVYLGDLSFRYANREDQQKSQEFMASIGGHKIFVLGNHDKMLGQEYFTKCGFDYVLEDFTWDKYVFTHRPINMSTYPDDWWNIHGHIHNLRMYNTTDGKRNINVYPYFYDNKPVTLQYLLDHKEELSKDNEWNFNTGYGESYVNYHNLKSTNKNMALKAILEQGQNPKPIVYYSPYVDSKTIAYMVSLFKDHLGDRIAIKLHFGEKGNQNFLNPKLLKDLVGSTNAALVDSNTAYDGSSRGTTEDHIRTAKENGFTFGYIDILDADGDITISVPKYHMIQHELYELANGKAGYASPVVPGRHLSEVNIGAHLKNYDSMIVYTHFKGHSIAGYGGSLKNIGMGIPSGKIGKKQIHGEDWIRGPLFLERLVESASAIEAMFDDKIVYVNVLQNMSSKCDCEKDAPKATIPDIGVLVSTDLVAIEQASLDFVRNAPKNKELMEQIAKVGGYHQIEYMKWLGMGSGNYILKTLDDKRVKLESSNIISEAAVILNGFTKDDVQKLFDSIPKGDVSYGQKHKDYKETIYRDMIPGKAFIELYKSPEGDKIASVAIDVHPDFRSQGLGTKLVTKAISNMDRLGINRIEWYCDKSNKASVKLAQKCGFKIDDNFSNKDKYTLYYGEEINSINENYFNTVDDVYYNKWKFDQGISNIIFITGIGGSGKSTMGRNLSSKNIEHVEMDEVIYNFRTKNINDFSSSMIKDFFKSYGKKYRNKSKEELFSDNKYLETISTEFVKYAIEYAKVHKNKKFIIDGVYIYWYINPVDIEEYPVFIKGTSSIESMQRAANRDANNKGFDNADEFEAFKNKRLDQIKAHAKENSDMIDKFRQYFNNKNNINENYITNMDDIYYNKKKFDRGEINVCFITGQSGSGKSTMGRSYTKKAVVVELDDIIWNKAYFTLEDLEFKYSKLVSDFFRDPKYAKYFVTVEELNNSKFDNYEKDLTNDFIDYTIKYAAKHKDIKFVLEGVWIYEFVDPKKIQDYAVYIKGTSMVVSLFRACKRDGKAEFLQPGMWLKGEGKLRKFRKYFLGLMMKQESTLLETKRSELPDSAFGIPEQRKFPLDSAKHVRSAIHLFGHAQEDKKKALAKRIKAAAKKYNISIPETTQCYKYLSEGAISSIIPDGVDTIVFDMGSVLVDANTIKALQQNPDIPNEYCDEIKDLTYKELFYAENMSIVQQMSIPEAKKYLSEKAPEHIKPYIDAIFNTFYPAMYWYPYVGDMLKMFRDAGYKLYYLSNWTRFSYELEKNFFDLLIEKFDGGLFSFELGPIMKPQQEMYMAFLNKYSLDPHRCIFFDDHQENVDAAKLIGMNAYKFDKNDTPNILFGTEIQLPENTDDTLIITDGDEGFKTINISDLTWWYICENDKPSNVDEECYYRTLDDAIRFKLERLISSGTFEDTLEITEYVFTNAKAFAEEKLPPELSSVGVITLTESGAYEWQIQYPLELRNGILKSVKETSLAAINPVIGVHKPFLIKVGDSRHPELLPTDHYVYSNDISLDKYLSINDENKLTVNEDFNDLKILEVYEYIGDKCYLDRLNRMYKNEETVYSIYTALTDKVLLTEDQIDFDSNFKKIDFDLLEQKMLSEMVTLRDNIMHSIGNNGFNVPFIESAVSKKPSFISKYNIDGLDPIIIKEDFDGMYFLNQSNNKRSISVASVNMLTENMIKAIL